VWDELRELFDQHGLKWTDWPEFFAATNTSGVPSLSPSKTKTILSLHVGTGDPDRARAKLAHKKLVKKFVEWKLTWWADLRAILAAEWLKVNPPSTVSPSQPEEFTVLDFPLSIYEDYMVLTPAQRLLNALWDLHTHCVEHFEVTPRLVLISPFSGHGKSRLLRIHKRLAGEARLTKSATAPAMYRRLQRYPRTTYLLDEGENQGVLTDRVMRALIDGGYEDEGSIDRADEEFPEVYFPCAFAIRGQTYDLPLSILSRSFIIEMLKRKPKKRLSKKTPDPRFEVAPELIRNWKAMVSFDPDPAIPAELARDSRVEDNCRVLIAIADSFGPEVGKTARDALIELCKNLPNQDPALAALIAAHAVFVGLKPEVDRMEGKAFVKAVVAEDDYFSDWRGPNDQGLPHELTSGELSRLLRRFGLRSKSMRLPNAKWGRGYYRADIESAWRAYCSENATATHPSKFTRLAKS
jgi:hypothetical protein